MAKKKQKQHDAFMRELWERADVIVNGAVAEGFKVYEDEKHSKPVVYTERSYRAARFAMKQITGILLGRIWELEERLVALEASPLSYQGVYEEAKSYPPRSIVSHGGSMWFSPEQTKSRPGEGAPWVLVVKRGADGKDAEQKRARTATRPHQ